MQTISSIDSASATRLNLGPLPTTFSPPVAAPRYDSSITMFVFMGAAVGYGCHDIQTSTRPCTAEDTNKRDGGAPCPLDMSGMDSGGRFCQSPPPDNLPGTHLTSYQVTMDYYDYGEY